MGLFDYFRSSYDIGEAFTDTNCHTKDIGDGIGGTMSTYWLDPNGVLWWPDYTGTSTFEVIEEGDPRYNHEFRWTNHYWEPTGQHGRLQPHPITKYIEVYPETWDGPWEKWPRCRLHFRDGVLQDFTDITNIRQTP
jgi:hypothetical protein